MVEKYVATLSNDLIEGKINKLNNIDYKLLLLLISKINPTNKEIKSPIKVELAKKDILEILSLHKNDYKVINKSLKKFEECYIILKNKGNIKLLKNVENPKNSHFIKVYFSEDIEKYITKLENNFTKIPLKQILRLNKKYSIKLYMLLLRFAYRSWRKDSITDIREKLSIENHQYKTFEAFERAVLKPSIKEINRRTDIKVSYEKEKIFKKVEYLKFKILKKQ